MRTIREAIIALRTTVQDFGDDYTRIGRSANIDHVRWIGTLLGFEWPQNYIELIRAHDGFDVRGAFFPDFMTAFEQFASFREDWHERRYWPVATDECGGYWVMSIPSEGSIDCPIIYTNHETDDDGCRRHDLAAESLADFVFDLMKSIQEDSLDQE